MQLNPLSSVFQPSKSTEMTVARVRDNGPETVSGGHRITRRPRSHRQHAYESDNPRSSESAACHREGVNRSRSLDSLSRLSLQSNASTIIATPTSQMSFAQNSPSPGMTWTTGSIASQNPYTPPLPANATYDNDTPGSFAPRLNGSRFERRWETAGEENPGRFLIVSGQLTEGTDSRLRTSPSLPVARTSETLSRYVQCIAPGADRCQDIAPYRAIIVKLLKTKGWVSGLWSAITDASGHRRVLRREGFKEGVQSPLPKSCRPQGDGLARPARVCHCRGGRCSAG